MEQIKLMEVNNVPQDPSAATKYIIEILLDTVYPVISRIRRKLKFYHEDFNEQHIAKLEDVFALCSSQIQKSFLSILETFKVEFQKQIHLQDSRQCSLERLSWCLNRLTSIESVLETRSLCSNQEDANNTILFNPMYFVNWIDHIFSILAKLSDSIYRTDYKENKELYEQWKNDIIDCVGDLHVSLDELLLSAMTLYKHCLPDDQLVVKARCQVVLREMKTLLKELLDINLDSAFKMTTENLKLPIMPLNVNVLIDVLKDVLYILETNTNTALLALVVHCFSYGKSPVDVLKKHFQTAKDCPCQNGGEENCPFVKDFDSYNERLLQIGSFAMSCSSDQNRILLLRSGLASLEALDPHLVPALMLSCDSEHSNLLMQTWDKEVEEIRNSVFLIVDPAAFSDKCKQMMQQNLLDIMKGKFYDNKKVCRIIDIGNVVSDLFGVYNKYEPDALIEREKLALLLTNLDKVVSECKVVSDLLSSKDDFVYGSKKNKHKTVSYDQIVKRLKLLYTLINRINLIFHPSTDDNQLFDDEEPALKDRTHTILPQCGATYINSPRPANVTKSIFARTYNRTPATNFPLTKVTKNLKSKNLELNFSIDIDQLFNMSASEAKCEAEVKFVNKHLDVARETSVLYNFSPKKNRSSLRKSVLSKYCKVNIEKQLDDKFGDEGSVKSDRGSLIDEAMSLQITEILNEMSSICGSRHNANSTHIVHKDPHNIVRLNINGADNTISKHIWKIPVNATTVELALDDSAVATNVSNVTAPSNVTTLERIYDIDLVESRLSGLRSTQIETSL